MNLTPGNHLNSQTSNDAMWPTSGRLSRLRTWKTGANPRVSDWLHRSIHEKSRLCKHLTPSNYLFFPLPFERSCIAPCFEIRRWCQEMSPQPNPAAQIPRRNRRWLMGLARACCFFEALVPTLRAILFWSATPGTAFLSAGASYLVMLEVELLWS